MRNSVGMGLVLASLVVTSLFCGCATSTTTTAAVTKDDTELLAVFAVSRHGIRSQTLPLATINQYTLRPQGFPQWPSSADVPDADVSDVPGNLSKVGEQNVVRLGAWYRDFYAARGLLPPRGSCPATGTVFVYADVMERTVHTAQAYLDGLFQAEATPDCDVEVLHGSGKADLYIDVPVVGGCKVDSTMDQAAISLKIGDNPASLLSAYGAELQTLQTVTQCCKTEVCATTQNPTPTSCSLPEIASVVSVDATTGVVGFGPLFSIADTVTETFLLEYAQGMPETGCATTDGAQCVGWGAIPQGGLIDLMKLHVAHFDLTYRLPSFAQAASSNLMWQLVGTLGQTLSGVKAPDMLAPTESKFTLFVGHDVNLTAIGGFLNVTWQAEGFQKDDPSPAGALVFELHRVKQSNQLIVRLFFVSASLDQMRYGAELTLQAPPQRIPLTIPACGNLDCPYEQFRTFITDHVREDCLITTGSSP
jgi:4-phytase / acid phosphatase